MAKDGVVLVYVYTNQDGDPISSTMSPEDFGMEDDYIINVHQLTFTQSMRIEGED